MAKVSIRNILTIIWVLGAMVVIIGAAIHSGLIFGLHMFAMMFLLTIFMFPIFID